MRRKLGVCEIYNTFTKFKLFSLSEDFYGLNPFENIKNKQQLTTVMVKNFAVFRNYKIEDSYKEKNRIEFYMNSDIQKVFDELKDICYKDDYDTYIADFLLAGNLDLVNSFSKRGIMEEIICNTNYGKILVNIRFNSNEEGMKLLAKDNTEKMYSEKLKFLGIKINPENNFSGYLQIKDTYKNIFNPCISCFVSELVYSELLSEEISVPFYPNKISYYKFIKYLSTTPFNPSIKIKTTAGNITIENFLITSIINKIGKMIVDISKSVENNSESVQQRMVYINYLKSIIKYLAEIVGNTYSYYLKLKINLEKMIENSDNTLIIKREKESLYAKIVDFSFIILCHFVFEELFTKGLDFQFSKIENKKGETWNTNFL
jgi:hypothetical protein